MNEDDIFPDRSEVIHRAVQALAKRMGCPEQLVDDCIGKLDLAWSDPRHLDLVGDTTEHFNRAARLARQLHRAMTLMSSGQRKDLEVAGTVTVFQIEHLADVLATDAESLSKWARSRMRTGGRNIAAYNVSELVRRVSRRMRLKITYGADSYGGPSTEFGRNVEFALSAFGIRGSWRGPTQEAVQRHLDFQRRMADCASRKWDKGRGQKP